MSDTSTAQNATSVVKIVVIGLTLLAFVGLVGLIFLIWDGAPADSIAVVAGPTSTFGGALAGILASTRSIDPAVHAQEVATLQEQIVHKDGLIAHKDAMLASALLPAPSEPIS